MMKNLTYYGQKFLLLFATLFLSFLLTACSVPHEKTDKVEKIRQQTTHKKVSVSEVLNHYADMAYTMYSDSLSTAKDLDKAINHFLDVPNYWSLNQVKKAWLVARIPYQQTEVYRFGNAIVDDWEGRVNAWPLDEGLIDYVDMTSYGKENDENSLYTANVIANTSFLVDGKQVDATHITSELLQNTLQEAGGIEANVATGYHAIEFLLWGQDLNGNNAGSGKRSYTDFSLKNCSNEHCERRRDYLKVASALLVSDLEEMVQNWHVNGVARQSLLSSSDKEGLRTILTGMGSLSYGELAGERMKLGLLLGDPEEEHDCFSDNTHYSHYYDALGMQNIYLGEYTKVDGSLMRGPSLSQLVASQNSATDKRLRLDLQATMEAMQVLVDRAENTESYDQMIATSNRVGNAVVQQAIDALVTQTKSIEKVMAILELGQVELEGSDSLDNPNAVFQ